LIVTRWSTSSFESASVSANVGISVLKRRVLSDLPYFVACANRPSIVVPFDVIELTFPSRTCWRKNGLYGMRTRGWCVARDAAQ
jgi:hypothetical protein